MKVRLLIVLTALLIAGAPVNHRPSGIETVSHPKTILVTVKDAAREQQPQPPASRDGSSWVGPWYAPTATPQPYPEPYPSP